MAKKLTNKQLAELENVLYDLERAYKYLEKPEITGIASQVKPERADGSCYHNEFYKTFNMPEYVRILDKEIGSDIAGFSFALSKLKLFIENNTK
jgi:hypothetical protein